MLPNVATRSELGRFRQFFGREANAGRPEKQPEKVLPITAKNVANNFTHF
jgi:hypothetical protein